MKITNPETNTSIAEIGDGIYREASDSVDRPNRLEHGARDDGLDACDDLRGAFCRLDRRKAPHGPVHDGVVRSLDEIGRLLDDIEDQVDEPPNALHGRSMDRLMGKGQSAPLRR